MKTLSIGLLGLFVSPYVLAQDLSAFVSHADIREVDLQQNIVRVASHRSSGASRGERGSGAGGGGIVAMTNRIRAEHGLKPLKSDSSLNALAQSWASHMSGSGSFEHPSDFAGHIARARPRSSASQNIAIDNSASGAMHAWMESSGHMSNILDSSATRIGVGHSGRYWVQDFAN